MRWLSVDWLSKMKMKILSIEFFLIAAFLFFYIGFFYDGDLIKEIDLSFALIIHSFGIISVIIGSLFYYLLQSNFMKNRIIYEISFSTRFYFLSYFFALLGLLVTLAQINQSQSPFDYIATLFSGNIPPSIRDSFLLSSSDGGLSGIIKMWGNSTLGVVLMLMGFLFFYKINRFEKVKFNRLLIFSIIILLLKVFFSMDRMSLFAFLLAYLFFMYKFKIYKNIRTIALFFIIFFIMDYLSKSRLEGYGIVDFLYLYFYLGLANLQLVFLTYTEYSYGFNSFLSPLVFVARFFGIDDFGRFFDYDWIWNPAQYGIGYLFLDFGYFYFLALFFIGFLSSIVTKKSYEGRIYYTSVFFVILYGFSSFVVVPAIRGLEFYIALLVPLFIVKFSRLIVE